jgi:hypothetical protein
MMIFLSTSILAVITIFLSIMLKHPIDNIKGLE